MWIIKDLGNGLHIATNNSTGEMFSGTKIEVDARIATGNSGTVTVFAKDENGNRVLAEDVSDNIVTAIKDSSGNVVGLGAGGEQCIVISSDPPSDSDGRVNGTIYIQVLQ